MPNPEYAELRGHLDGQDPFMTGGHQIMKTRRGNRIMPEWAKSNKKVQEILIRSFPKLRTNPGQRERAARWATVIHLYFRMQMTSGQVASQMKVTSKVVYDLILRINRASKGLKASGTGPLRGRPAGRPKKNSAVSQTAGG
jgi:hypothetical protein